MFLNSIASFDSTVFVLSLLIFTVAILYSSVGHGGASGYLAILSFFVFSPDEMASIALVLNLCVASLAFITFAQKKYFCWKFTWPFILFSLPMAFLGGLLTLSPVLYYRILFVVLLFSAYKVFFLKVNQSEGDGIQKNEYSKPAASLPIRLFWGGLIGFFSGIIGIGGGIFLSPLIVLNRWATAKQAATVSALFIMINASAGLIGRFARNAVVLESLWPLLIAGILGGLLGSNLGAQKYSPKMLRQVLGFVLFAAAVKLLLFSYR